MPRGRPETTDQQKADSARAAERRDLQQARQVPADTFENIMERTAREGKAADHAAEARKHEKKAYGK